MIENPNTPPPSPFKLTTQRIVLLALGALMLVYIVSALLGGLGNYQELKEAAQEAEATTPPTSAN